MVRPRDAAFFDEDHLLKFVDRKKGTITSGDENVSTRKGESTLLDHSDGEELAVVGLPHERWGEAVIAFVVPAADADPEAIEAYASERLRRTRRPP